jgi:HTH-type transcriptional regulator/antitoxin HipB
MRHKLAEIWLAHRPVVADNFPNGKLKSHDIHSITSTTRRCTARRSQATRADQPQLALAAGVGVRFIVDLEAGKPTLRLENVLRVIDALGGEVQLSGLPSVLPTTNVRVAAMAHELEVWLFADRVGTLALVDGRLSFCYAPGWLSHKDAVALSASLPCKRSRSTIAKRAPSLPVCCLKGRCAA